MVSEKSFWLQFHLIEGWAFSDMVYDLAMLPFVLARYPGAV